MKSIINYIVMSLIGIVGIVAFKLNDKPTNVSYEPVKIEWWQQFIKTHTIEEIVDAAYEAGTWYNYNHCEEVKTWRGNRQVRLTKYRTDMSPLERDFYQRIYNLGDSETERCVIAKDPGKFLL